ncbi:MAG TPA: PspA/IM30 family protein [Anaerolineae bacterium]|nr:PspA/IM30 family protein [Anaerolineae bacterium]
MASLMEKVGVLIKANLHSMVDSALRQNSVAVIDQYIRQIEDNLEDLEDATATIGGQVKSVKRRLTDHRKKAGDLDTNIDLFLGEGKETLAIAAQSKLNSTKRLLAEYEQQLELLTSEHQKLMDAKLKLEAKLTTTKQEREELQALLDLARSKEISVRAIRSLDDLVGAGDTDVSRIAEGIRSRLDRATAEMEMVAGRLDKQMDEVLERHEIEIQLGERRTRLGLAD